MQKEKTTQYEDKRYELIVPVIDWEIQAVTLALNPWSYIQCDVLQRKKAKAWDL